MKAKFKIFILLFIFSTSSIYASLNYEVTVGVIGSGTLKVSKIHHGTNDYSLLIQGDVKIPFRQIIYYTNVRIKNSKLFQSEVSKTVNGSLKEKTLISKEEENYLVEKSEKDISKVSENVKFTVAMLYLNEPLNQAQIFSEKFGVFCPLISQSDNRYELQLPDGIKTVYHYAFGICTYVKTKFMGQTVEFKLK
jgi:hypothetical protein